MKKNISINLLLFVCFISGLLATSLLQSERYVYATDSEKQQVTTNEKTIYFFHSITCPHCKKEQVFLDTIQKKYPDLKIVRYEVSEKESVQKMIELGKQYHVEHLLGGVPLTFVGDEYFLGFDDADTTGADIERAIRALLSLEGSFQEEKYFEIPFLGKVHSSDFSLPFLAITLGFLDGFNVCSLGALMLIIGLTLKLQQRKTIILIGGTFVLTTALVYGGLIVLWYKIFEYLNTYLSYIKMIITVLALGGGVYFLKEYIRMKKNGAVCSLQESNLINRLMEKTGKSFEDNTKLVGLISVVLLFAAVVAVVEFPCSAATPLIFAGILADSGLTTLAYLMHISLFVLFYMLDEIIIFVVAAYRLKLWMTNGTFTKYAVLTEAIILIVIGGIYFNTVVDFVTPLKNIVM